jgi:hypothetical protein
MSFPPTLFLFSLNLSSVGPVDYGEVHYGVEETLWHQGGLQLQQLDGHVHRLLQVFKLPNRLALVAGKLKDHSFKIKYTF